VKKFYFWKTSLHKENKKELFITLTKIKNQQIVKIFSKKIAYKNNKR
jgi:hypothetical protein